MLVNVHGFQLGRATRDIDFGIAVETWEEFDVLKTGLAASGLFAPNARVHHRLMYTDDIDEFTIPVDLIPFRGVSTAHQTLEWPPERDIVFNVAGFEEAWMYSIPVAVEDDLVIRVASIPGPALLKLIAWSDRHLENSKDASDLLRLMSTCADAGNLDRLYGPELELLQASGFDVELAGARLLGCDVARSCISPTAERIRACLSSPRLHDALTAQLIQAASEYRSAAVARLANAFCQGFLNV